MLVVLALSGCWLRDLHGQLVASRNWQPDTRLVVTFDEGSGGSNRVVTIIAGPRVRPRHDDTAYDHYSLLRSIETLFRLPRLGHAADPSTATIPALADSKGPLRRWHRGHASGIMTVDEERGHGA